jgi:hypothetical protein
MTEETDKIITEMGFGQYVQAKPKTPQAQTPNIPQGRDLFQTPNYAVDLLIPFIPKHISWVWEPACGEGKIVKRLLDKTYLDVFASDIRHTDSFFSDHINFLEAEKYPDNSDMPFHGESAIITNPPFSLKEKFYKKCKSFGVPFALLIPADYSSWIIKACRDENAEKIIPLRRIDYITPSGKSGASGHTADFHSMWLTWGFGLGKTETFVELSLENKKNNI